MTAGPPNTAVAWLPPAAWALLIFTASSFPIRAGGGLPAGADKAVHLVEYGILGLLAARALRITRPSWPRGRVLLLGAALAAGYGATDEVHQAFVPERTPDLVDLTFDAAGALAGAALWTSLRGRSGVSAPR